MRNAINIPVKVASKAILLATFCFLSYTNLQAQAVGVGGIEAGFGVDGDLATDTALNGLSTGNGKPSDDWFRTPAVKNLNLGMGIIDTTGAWALRQLLQSSSSAMKTTVFTRPMSVPKLSRSNGYILLDALYAKDQLDQDATSVTGPAGVKLIDDPNNWLINSSSLSAKTDIMEFYSHLKRKGVTVFDSLFFYLGVGIYGTAGSKNITAELFVNDVYLDTVTRQMVNLGAQGGRVAWQFDSVGNPKVIGDMIITIDYTGGIFTLMPHIWMRRSTHDSFIGVSPPLYTQNFRLSTFHAQTSTGPGDFGYCEILPIGGASTMVAKASENFISTLPAAPWGTAVSTGYTWSPVYNSKQFVEMSINFTALGVDPSLFAGIDPCTTPFRSIIFYSQSSVSASSAPKDFAGPYPFWRYPRVISKIEGGDTLNCAKTSGSIYADSAYPLAYYHWTTPDGNIISYSADSTEISFNQPGTYYLETAPLRGCYTLKDTVVILQDNIHPIAKATVTDTIMDGSLPYIYVYGGDTAASNALLNSSIFGPAGGYSFYWTGPGGFTSTQLSPLIGAGGDYVLKLTSLRNACFDLDTVIVTQLPLTLLQFQCQQSDLGMNISWLTTDEEDLSKFEIQKLNGRDVIPLGFVTPLNNYSLINKYDFWDKHPNSGWNSYRIKAYDVSGAVTYSDWCAARFGPGKNELNIKGNPVYNLLRFELPEKPESESLNVALYSSDGRLMWQSNLNTGQLGYEIDTESWPSGIYLIQVRSGEVLYTGRFVKLNSDFE
jgi:hypothetical protein